MNGQQINLYQDVFREKTLPVSIRQVGLAALVLVLLLAAISGFEFWQRQGLESQLAERKQEKAGLEQKVAEMQRQFRERHSDKRLQQKVDSLSDELAAKQRILQALSGKRFGNTRGFVPHLGGLARQRVEGLWLTELALKQGGTLLDMQGHSLKAEYVPNYLQKLSAEPIFAGMEFDNLVMRRNEKHANWMNFQLNSRVGQEQAP